MFSKLSIYYNKAKTYYGRFSTHFHFLTSISLFFMLYLALRDFGLSYINSGFIALLLNILALLGAILVGKYIDIGSGNYKREIATSWELSPNRANIAHTAAMNAMFSKVLKKKDLDDYAEFVKMFYDDPITIMDYFKFKTDILCDKK